MAKTIESLEALVNKDRQARAKYEEKLKEQTAIEDRLLSAIDDAVAVDDMETYQKLSAKLNDTKTLCDSYRSLLARPAVQFADTDISEAWNAYLTDYEPKIKKAITAYDKAKKDMVAKYAECAKMQNECLRNKQRLFAVTGKLGFDKPVQEETKIPVMSSDGMYEKELAELGISAEYVIRVSEWDTYCPELGK